MNIAIVTGASSGMGREFALQLSGFVDVEEQIGRASCRERV